jgi:hypothetical protein
MAALTYEPPRQDRVDSVFPGENWFFYWKSAASLWEEKISALTGSGPLYVPINWAFHVEGVPGVDFGTKRADCDLQRIEDICVSNGRQVFFLLPLGSFPFLVNGGVPSHLVKYPAISEKGLIAACLDSDNRLNQMTSFFDPGVFKQFQIFCGHLCSYFDQCKMSSALIGVESGYFDKNLFHSYFTDYSKGFELGFSRYLKVKSEDSRPDNALEEQNLRFSYQEEMFSLYETVAKEFFQERWLGKVRVAFLGGSPVEVFKRGNEGRDCAASGIVPFLRLRAEGFIPSSILLESKQKDPLFLRFLKENAVQIHQSKQLEQAGIDDLENSSFQDLFIFEILQNESNRESWNEMGALAFFQEQFANLVNFSQSLEYLKTFESSLAKVFLISGDQLGEAELRRVLKLFLASGKIILDKNNIEANVLKRLNAFFLENELEENHLYFMSPVTHYSLGEGSITLIDGAFLKGLPEPKKLQFWEKLVSALNVSHQRIESYQEIYSTWQSRPATGHELDYMEIRRLALYNPSSYRGKVKISLRKDFSLLKILDENGVKSQKNGSILTFELAPGGAVKLDFGFFELE